MLFGTEVEHVNKGGPNEISETEVFAVLALHDKTLVFDKLTVQKLSCLKCSGVCWWIFERICQP